MKVKLGDVFSIIRNGANIKQGVVDGGFPITRIETISDRFIDRTKMGYAGIEQLDKYSEYVMQDGDILMSHINSEKHLGKTALYEKECDEVIIHGMNLLLLRPIKESVLSKYAFYFLSSQAFLRQIPNITKKSVNQASFNITAIKDLDFIITPLERQQKIVDNLDKIGLIIDYRKQQLHQLDELVKARFIEMFGTPLVNEKEWSIKNTGEICVVTDGSHFSPLGKDEGYPMLSVKNMRKDGFNYNGCKLVSQEDYELLVKQGCKPLKDDVLIAKDGSYFYYGFVVKEEIEQAVLSSIAILRPNKEQINPEFLCRYMLSNEIVDLVGKNYVTGAAIKRVILKGIKQIPIMMPPLELQNEFATFVEQVDKSKFVIQKALDEAQTLFDSLMQEYFG